MSPNVKLSASYFLLRQKYVFFPMWRWSADSQTAPRLTVAITWGREASAERRLYLTNQRPPHRPAVQCGRVRLSRQLDCESSGRGSRTFVEMFELFGTNDLRIVKFDTGRMRLCEEGKAKKFLETTKTTLSYSATQLYSFSKKKMSTAWLLLQIIANVCFLLEQSC